MPADRVVDAIALVGHRFRASLRDVSAGMICSVLSTAYCLSYAALIFSGPLAAWLSYGIAVTFLSAAVAAAVVALRSSLPFAIAGPDTSTSAVTATLMAAIAARLVADGSSHLLEPALIVIGRRPECRFLVFDFHLVTGIDSSATHSFSQIKDAAAECQARLVLINLTPELERAFRIARFISEDMVVAPNLDHALEYCEQAVIGAHQVDGGETRSLRAWLSEALGSPEHGDRMADHCHRLEFQPGDIIARQGDAADTMHFILDGRIGILVDLGEGRTVRVRSLGQHTTIGEMGLITRRPRSATIQAEVASVLYELRADAYEQIKRQNPALSQALLCYVIAVMAERLSFASRAIGVLQRDDQGRAQST